MCSIIRFCYTSNSGSDVWELPSEMASSKYDFTEVTQPGYAEGQKAAISVDDYDEVGLTCHNMGTTSSRISKCTCNFEERKLSSLSEPSHSQFIGAA